MSRRVPAAEAQGRLFSYRFEALFACEWQQNGKEPQFGDVQCTDLVEIYPWMRLRGLRQGFVVNDQLSAGSHVPQGPGGRGAGACVFASIVITF